MSSAKFIILGNAGWDSAGMGGNSSQQYARALLRADWEVAFGDPQGQWHLSGPDSVAPNSTIVMCDFPYSSRAKRTFDTLRDAGCRTVVRICDHWKSIGAAALYQPELEVEFVEKAQCAVALNPLNIERFKDVRPNMQLLRNGVDLDHFWDAARHTRCHMDRSGLNIGVVASFWFRDWIDLGPVLSYARRHPNCRIHLVGHARRILGRSVPENVVAHGPKLWAEVATYMWNLDVGVIPYDPHVTEYVNPTKALEYLASGIPVVSCPNVTLKDYPYTYCYESGEGFEFAVEQALDTPIDREKLLSFLRENTWERKFETILDWVGWSGPRVEPAGSSVDCATPPDRALRGH